MFEVYDDRNRSENGGLHVLSIVTCPNYCTLLFLYWGKMARVIERKLADRKCTFITKHVLKDVLTVFVLVTFLDSLTRRYEVKYTNGLLIAFTALLAILSYFNQCYQYGRREAILIAADYIYPFLRSHHAVVSNQMVCPTPLALKLICNL